MTDEGTKIETLHEEHSVWVPAGVHVCATAKSPSWSKAQILSRPGPEIVHSEFDLHYEIMMQQVIWILFCRAGGRIMTKITPTEIMARKIENWKFIEFLEGKACDYLS